MELVSFRRQFFAIPSKSGKFRSWNILWNDAMSLYFHIHPDLEFCKVKSENNSAVLLGFILDPGKPDSTNENIIYELIKDKNKIEEIFNPLSQLTGRFVLFININGNNYVFHDPMGLRTLVYGKIDEKYCFASDTAILTKLFPLQKADFYYEFRNSKHQKHDSEFYLPAGLTLYKDFRRLIPNHYFDLAKEKDIRFWPIQKIIKIPVDAAAKKASTHLQNIIKAIASRYNLALPLTSGWDSRVILSACKEFVNSLFIYTLLYNKLNENTEDCLIPKIITNDLKLKHHTILCKDNINSAFFDIYMNNSSLSNKLCCMIANEMDKHYPKDRIVLKGNGVDISKAKLCDNAFEQKHPNINRIFEHKPYWRELEFCKREITKWFNEAKTVSKKTRVSVYDLYFIEHRYGSWQAQSQLEWDIVQEVFSPANYRPLITALISAPVKYRNSRNEFILNQKIIKELWPELMKYRINGKIINERTHPSSFSNFIYAIRTFFYKKGLSREALRKIVKTKIFILLT